MAEAKTTDNGRPTITSSARLLLLLTVLLTLSFSACTIGTNDSQAIDFDLSVDVSSVRWTKNDTLFYPIHVTEQPEVRTPLHRGIDYQIWYSIRHEATYGYRQVPLTLIVQQTDSFASPTVRPQVLNNLMRSSISPSVRDEAGRPLGVSWGSLFQHEELVEGLTLRFDSTGYYRILLIPDIPDRQPLQGISSIGLSLRRP